MTAGFMILRILMLFLIKEVTYGSAFSGVNTGYKAWQDGGQKPEVFGYHRPLHYVRSLRQPKNNLINTRQNPQRSGVKDLTPGLTFKQTPRHLWPQNLPVQPGPQRSYPLVQPRGFRVSLDLPFYKLDQMKETDTPTKTQPKLQTKPNVQSGLSISEFQSPERDFKKDTNVGKNIHGVPTSNFQVNLNIPLPAASLKTIGKLVENKSPGNIFQTSYSDLGKRLSSIHTELKSTTISHKAGEQTRKQLGSTWSNYPATGPKKTLQQPDESIYTQPTDSKLTSSTWQLISPQRNYGNPTARQSLASQKPFSTKPPSLSFVKYLERLGLNKAQTSPRREDVVQLYSTQKQHSSPLQYNRESQDNKYVGVGSQSVGLPQNSYTTSGAADIKDFTSDQKGEKKQDSAVPTLQLEFPFPVKTLSNLAKGGGYFTIKPQNIESLLTHYMEAKKLQSPESEFKKSVLGFDDAGHHRTTGLPERKWPILNLELEPKQKKPPPYESVTVKPTDQKPSFSSWFPRDSEIGKPRFPVLAISKYLIDATRPLNSKYKTIQPKPLQSERLQSFYSSLKPITNSYVESQPRPSTIPSASTHDNPFKPYSDLQKNAEIDSIPHHRLFTYGSSSSSMLEVVPAKRPQTWQKPISSLYLHEYNSGKEPSYDATFEDVTALHSMPSSYKVQNKFPKQDNRGHIQEGKDYSVKPFHTNEGSFVSGQTYQTGNTAGTSFNVQPPCESSFSRLGQDGSFSDLRYSYLNAESHPCSQVPCLDGVGKCVNEANKRNTNFPQRVSYSPKAEATSISIPFSTFERIFTQSSYQPARNGFKLQQYPVGQEQP